MNFAELRQLVEAEYDQRELASNVRYNALKNFEDFLKSKAFPIWNDVSGFPIDKCLMKEIYRQYQQKDKLNGAETSMINEVYNQINKLKIELTDYSKNCG